MAYKLKIYKQNKLEITFSSRQKTVAFQKKFLSTESFSYLWPRLGLGVKKPSK
jgi:hypothetical protein